MIKTYRRLQRRRAAGEIEGGFTLIELLIVIVVLGILAAVVVFALGGVTAKSAVAACQADAKTVGVAVAALQAENPSYAPTTSVQWQTDLTAKNAAIVGSPFLQSWPTGSSAYTIAVAPASPVVDTGDKVLPATGDVIVTVTSGGLTYDATQAPVAACQTA